MEDSKETDSTGFVRRVDGKFKKVLDYSFQLNSGIPKIDVCLRLKPQLDDKCEDTLEVLNDTTVSYSNGNIREGVTRLTFSSVFGSNVDQKEFFNTWVCDKVLRFLNGNNELLIAYGTTDAGKTYTMHGSLNDPGLVPRTLVCVFNTLNNKLMAQCKYKPDKVMAVQVLDEQLMEHEEDIRNKILNNLSFDDAKYSSQLDERQTINGIDNLNSNNIGKIFDLLKNDEKVSLDHGDVSYTVWVTYSEIYNESIYDLFDINCSANQKRIPLKLALDKNKNIYVKGLTHVYVRSAEEAYKAISFGRNNLKITSNTLTKSSSRSHCIFTLKLMRVENIELPTPAVISSFTFCDLASSECLKKTMNMSDRLTESKKINTSLLVLNKCFSVIHDNHKCGDNHLVPFRESKLTRMFQTALTGINQTGISMALNVDMSPGLFEETKQVLFMFATVRSITKLQRRNLIQAKSKQNTIFENKDSDCSESEKKKMVDNKDLERKAYEERKKLMLTDNTYYNKQKKNGIKNKTEILHLKSLEKIQENDNDLTSLLSSIHHDHINSYVNKGEIENHVFQMDEFRRKEELMIEIDVLKAAHQKVIDKKNQEIKDLKIERVIDSLEAKENCIAEMEIYQEQQITKCAEKKILKYMKKQSKKIVALKDNLKKEKMKHKICLQDRSEIVMKYKNLKQQYRNTAKCINQLTLSNTELSSELADIKTKITELKEYAASFASTLVNNEIRYNNELQAALKEKCVKPESKNIAVLTDINNVEFPLTMVIDSDSEENKNTVKKSTRKCRIKTPMSTTKKLKNIKYGDTPEMCEKMLYEFINNIPNSTHKRKLFDNKPPLSDNSKIPTDNQLDPILTPTNALHQTAKFRHKKFKK